MPRSMHLLAGLGVIAALAFGSAVATAEPGPGFDVGGQALAAAERGAAMATRPIPPPPACDRVIVIGDSLTVGSRTSLRNGLADAGVAGIVDAYGSRRIPESVPAPYSGVKAARAVKASFGEADCWVIALGTNDLNLGAYIPATADALIDEMLAEVTPDASVWWVNINHRNRSSSSTDYRARTAAFNGVLDGRAEDDPKFEVIDWYTLSEANTWWFVDHVHVIGVGYLARAGLILDALPLGQPEE